MLVFTWSLYDGAAVPAEHAASVPTAQIVTAIDTAPRIRRPKGPNPILLPEKLLSARGAIDRTASAHTSGCVGMPLCTSSPQGDISVRDIHHFTPNAGRALRHVVVVGRSGWTIFAQACGPVNVPSRTIQAPLAQLAEQLTLNQRVRGS
ncbi:hypothetical protein, partial [Williamsia sp.]|uniref:hypothetical protein n=1 Tax=Williamsia sp. TaxID=1872085 RepID=UPI0025D7842D